MQTFQELGQELYEEFPGVQFYILFATISLAWLDIFLIYKLDLFRSPNILILIFLVSFGILPGLLLGFLRRQIKILFLTPLVCLSVKINGLLQFALLIGVITHFGKILWIAIPALLFILYAMISICCIHFKWLKNRVAHPSQKPVCPPDSEKDS